jgi:hypothetical protein
MNIKEKLSCTYCNQIFRHPITLICCGKNICKKHIEELINEKSTNTFSCPLCSQENSNQNFNSNELIESLIEIELHRFELDPKYETAMNDFKSEIANLESIVKDPENIIYEEIRELKRQVDLDRESLKIQIDTLANGLIEQWKHMRKDLRLNTKQTLV